MILKKMMVMGLAMGAAITPVTARASVDSGALFVVAPAAGEDDSSYSEGTRAMNSQKWAEAITAFDKVIAAKGKRAAAAMYWKAYCLDKLDKKTESAAECDALKAQYESSSWNYECTSLEMGRGFDGHAIGEMARAQAQAAIASAGVWRSGDFPHREPRDPDAEMKILALNSVMKQDPAKAIPILRGILSGDQKDSVKKQALFVLMQSKTPEAQGVVNEIALGKLAPGMQRETIQMMGVFEGPKANETLAEVYRTTSDMKIKKAVISSFFITRDAGRMVEIARGEKDLELKREIVSQLALMHDKVATDYMMELLK